MVKRATQGCNCKQNDGPCSPALTAFVIQRMIWADILLSTKMAKQKPKQKDTKRLTERINLRVTEKEYALLELASQKDERSLSNWARRALVHEARRQLGKKT